jgi:Ca-activated chloride channel family protein
MTRDMVKSLLCCSLAVGAWLALSASVACSQENPEAPAGTIRVRVNMVDVGVIVTDADGKFVEGLGREDFHVLDDGAEQPIVYFSLDQPSHVLLLIEAGPAAYLVEGGHLRAAFALLAGLSAEDQVAVVKYAERPEVISDFSADKQVAGTALEHLNFNLGFGALNLSDSIAGVVDWLDKTQGKKTIVVLSSGVDTSALETAASLLQRLQVGSVRVLAVSLAGELRPAAPSKKKTPSSAAILSAQQFAAADEVLRQLAVATGGRAYFPADAKGFVAAYAEIAQIVRHEYSLGFMPQQLDGKVHRIEVRVTTDGMQADGTQSRVAATDKGRSLHGLRVDHRQGYVARPSELLNRSN